MANSTAGQLIGAGFVGFVGWMRVAAAPLNGAGQNRVFDTWDFPDVVNGNWQRWVLPNPITSNGNKVLLGSLHNTVGAATINNGGNSQLWGNSYAGSYKIVGQTRLNNTPFPARVVVYPENNPAIVVRGTTTDATGNFVFTGLAAGKYLVVGIDINDQLNGKIWALVDAVPM